MTNPKSDRTEHHSVVNEIEVAATPEQVWHAIATGPGTTAWFMPAEFDDREGGNVSFDMGSGMAFGGVIRTWDPPRRFVYEEEWRAKPGQPPARLATELIVEARSGGTCVVKLVSNLFTSGGNWDDELDSFHRGWETYLENLRLYLTRFPGQRCSTILVMGNASGTKETAWEALLSALGFGNLDSSAVGQRVSTAPAGAPELAGVVKRVGMGDHFGELAVELEKPAPGYALFLAFSWQGQVLTTLHAYLFGEGAPALAERDQPRWAAWMQERFPSAPEPTS